MAQQPPLTASQSEAEAMRNDATRRFALGDDGDHAQPGVVTRALLTHGRRHEAPRGSSVGH
jgi:hypothetical protein